MNHGDIKERVEGNGHEVAELGMPLRLQYQEVIHGLVAQDSMDGLTQVLHQAWATSNKQMMPGYVGKQALLLFE